MVKARGGQEKNAKLRFEKLMQETKRENGETVQKYKIDRVGSSRPPSPSSPTRPARAQWGGPVNNQTAPGMGSSAAVDAVAGAATCSV